MNVPPSPVDVTAQRIPEVLASLVRPRDRLRFYLYWQPERWRGRLFAAVNPPRPFTTQLPFPVLIYPRFGSMAEGRRPLGLA